MKSNVVILFYMFIMNYVYGIPQRVTTSFIPNAIVYPSEDTNRNHTSTIHNRQPVIDRKRCNEASELLYPGDNERDWVCDCKPAYLYMPTLQKCFMAYSKGPCSDDYFLYKDENSSIPKCVLNPCKRDGYVYFQNRCYALNGEEGCENYKKLIGRKVILTVDPTTLQLQCRDEDDKFKCENSCCKGGLRDSIGKCDKQTTN
ncbi:hypothetical protein PVAND_001190 [Polypedilum vanderplanki]|uniref:DUF4789 domain-containing protein n=1 Tax=Polypedilum vanderplanki TaxID=319348 RepID=A0A9J6BM57_POLVA|nr:hypothetical protein PVAND_001190 [Polypedilum vanderplanki]